MSILLDFGYQVHKSKCIDPIILKDLSFFTAYVFENSNIPYFIKISKFFLIDPKK